MIIERAEMSDLAEILELQYLAYQSEAKLLNNPNIPPLQETIDQLMEEYEKGIILKAVEENGEIIGSVRAYLENDTVHIGKLIVHPTFQGKGIGTKLLHTIENEYGNVRYELFTSKKSTRNIKLYERIGYKVFKEEQIKDDLIFVFLYKTLKEISCKFCNYNEKL